MNKEKVTQTDWMIMGMIHAYKILGKTKDEQKDNANLNDVDYLYLTEMQKRNIENPSLLSAEFPYVFLEENSSAHDQVHLGMMNVFTMLDEQKVKGQDLNYLDVDYLVDSLTKEMDDSEIVSRYHELFQNVKNEQGNLEDLK